MFIEQFLIFKFSFTDVVSSPVPIPTSTDSVDSIDAEVSDAFAGVENQVVFL